MGGTEIGYCFIGDGSNFRYTFARRGDAIVGPYYLIPEMRGHGLASMLICSGLDDYAPRTGTAWDFIQHNNTASIKTSEIVGFAYYSDCKYSGLLRVLNVCEYSMGDQQLFCKRG